MPDAKQWLRTTWWQEHLPNQMLYLLDCFVFTLCNKPIQHIYILLFIRNENLPDLLPGSMLCIPQGETRFNVSIINSGLAWEELSSMVFFGILEAVGHAFKMLYHREYMKERTALDPGLFLALFCSTISRFSFLVC